MTQWTMLYLALFLLLSACGGAGKTAQNTSAVDAAASDNKASDSNSVSTKNAGAQEKDKVVTGLGTTATGLGLAALCVYGGCELAMGEMLTDAALALSIGVFTLDPSVENGINVAIGGTAKTVNTLFPDNAAVTVISDYTTNSIGIIGIIKNAGGVCDAN